MSAETPTSTDALFPAIRFRGRLRPSQQAAIEIARGKLAEGHRRLHVVAPPGSGKTVLGLYLWAKLVRRPALVLSPNSAIQAQWAARVDLFETPASRALASTDGDRPALLTSLTYQSVTLPRSGDQDIDQEARELWAEKLIDADEAEDFEAACVWIDDLARHNPGYYDSRLATYRKQVRDVRAMGGDSLSLLHASSRDALTRLSEHGVGLIILDECHHLMGHWGRVLADAQVLFDDPVILGLTATPPDRTGKAPEDQERYDKFFGSIDYEIPVPAVVKDGYLAPYQDLAYFVRPTDAELEFLAKADEQLHAVVDELCADRDEEPGEIKPESSGKRGDGGNSEQDQPVRPEPLDAWLLRVLSTLELPTGKVKNWAAFERRDATLATAARLFLAHRNIGLPPGVPEPDPLEPIAEGNAPELAVLVPVLDRYVRHRLRRSPEPADQQLAARVIQKLRLLGIQITETGTQPCASPVGRVMAYAQGKTRALLPILRAERAALGEAIRAVVVADFEKTSAVTAEVRHLLDAEAGGAVAAFRMLLSDAEMDALDPILLTGSCVLVDDDLVEQFLAAARQWLQQHQREVELSSTTDDGFHVINGSGRDWSPRTYVHMITDLFQQGVSRCLVGTRGLLGEGWDAHKVNVLVDLTTVTTSMSVNQLRGRSIRLDPDEPTKVADNWDVICLAPEFSKGLDDYARFIAKHKVLYGVTDDGEVEKGVGHVHAALTELKPEGVEGSVNLLNEDMLARASERSRFRELWKIGQPYALKPLRTLEVRTGEGGGLPPFKRRRDPWTGRSLAVAIGQSILAALEETGQVSCGAEVEAGQRQGGYVRVFLSQAGEDDVALFTRSLHEALGPLSRPRYVIPRYVDDHVDTWLSRLLPQIVGRYLQRRQRRLAVLHAVPSALARKRELAEVYQRYWNQWVSPGEVVYALQGEGEEVLSRALAAGQVPRHAIHEKEIFR